MKQLRYGFKLMWREVPATMKRYRVGPVGSFDKNNGHDGKCWGWPSECKLTNVQAKGIFYGVYKRRRVTINQLIVVRKALAYAWELVGGAPGGNFPGVKAVWKVVRADKLADALARVVPQRIPTVADLRKAFGKEWTRDSPLNLVKYKAGLIAAYDSKLCGLRSKEDIDRVKKSVDHDFDWSNGWECTSFLGGRAKLCGTKKGTRPWAIWTVCFCKGKKHTSPPADFGVKIGKDGNPREGEEVTWSTNCPLSCLQLLWQLQETPRRYGKWLNSGRFGSSNIADVVGCANDWFVAQGVCTAETAFDSNSGRKCLARWSRHLRLEYKWTFQIMGDLPEVWRKSYDNDLPKTDWKIRTQSTDPDFACFALRKFANVVLERGKRVKERLSRDARLSYSLLKALKGREAALRALDGLSSSDDEDDMD